MAERAKCSFPGHTLGVSILVITEESFVNCRHSKIDDRSRDMLVCVIVVFCFLVFVSSHKDNQENQNGKGFDNQWPISFFDVI